MDADTDAGDRPGTPSESDRAFAEWFREEYGYGTDQAMAGEEEAWHAAVAWATRQTAERASEFVRWHPNKGHPAVIAFQEAVYKAIPYAVRSDPDAPAPTTKE